MKFIIISFFITISYIVTSHIYMASHIFFLSSSANSFLNSLDMILRLPTIIFWSSMGLGIAGGYPIILLVLLIALLLLWGIISCITIVIYYIINYRKIPKLISHDRSSETSVSCPTNSLN